MIWDKVFKIGLSKVCGRQPSKNLKEYGLLKHGLGSPSKDRFFSLKSLVIFHMIFTPEEGTTKESDPVSSKVIFHVLSKYLIVFVMAV